MLIKEQQKTWKLIMYYGISRNLLNCTCCIIIGYLYREMLKVDLKKALKQKMKLFYFMVFSILGGSLFTFYLGTGMSSSDSTFPNVDILPVIFQIFYFFEMTLVAPFIEEITFRRVFFQLIKGDNSLRKAIKKSKYTTFIWLVALMIYNSSIFSFIHVKIKPGIFSRGFIYFLAGGLSFCLCCDICDTILSPLILHIAYNFFVAVKIYIVFIYGQQIIIKLLCTDKHNCIFKSKNGLKKYIFNVYFIVYTYAF